MERLNILVFGAGAIGTYVGGSLALAGHPVVFVEQPKAVEELRARGLLLDLSLDGGRRMTNRPPSTIHRLSSVEFFFSLEEALQHGPFDVAIFALKSFDTAAALQGMKPHAHRLPPLLFLSNGVDNEPALAALLGAEKVIAGTVTSSVGRRAVGDSILERRRGVGIAATHPLSARLARAFDQAGLKARLYPSPGEMKWSKMLTNLLANATSAILDMKPAEIYAHPGLYRLEMQMLGEALAVMKAQKLEVVNLPGTPVRALALATKLPAALACPLMIKAVGGGRGGKMPSFHIDLYAGRGRSEVEWLNGAVARHGEECGVPAPVNRFLTETLLALMNGTRPLSEFSRQPARLLSEADRCRQM